MLVYVGPKTIHYVQIALFLKRYDHEQVRVDLRERLVVSLFDSVTQMKNIWTGSISPLTDHHGSPPSLGETGGNQTGSGLAPGRPPPTTLVPLKPKPSRPGPGTFSRRQEDS